MRKGLYIYPEKWYRYFLIIPFFQIFSATGQSFTEVSLTSGIIHHNVSPDYMGGGVAFFDYNNDGFEDIYLTGGTRDDKLYKNNGDGTFTDISAESGINNVIPAKSTGVVTGDINNDGFRDIFVAVQGTKPNFLYLNNGDGTFSEISGPAGIKGNTWSMGAAFGDVNLDGFLDLYVINYIKSNNLIYDENNSVSGFAHTCFADELYINNGDNTFTDVSIKSGINSEGCGLAVAFTDFDDDDVPDLYIANDFGEWVQPNMAYRNNNSSQFIDLSAQTGLNVAIYGMGIAAGDYDHNGKLDYYISNLGKNVLLKNSGDGTYGNVAQQANVENELVEDLFATSWGTAFMDYDLDGWEDLVVSNGYMPAAKFIETHKEDPNKLYRNLGNDNFEDVSASSGIDDIRIGRGLATADYDNDGDPDVLISNVNIISATAINPSFYRNEINNGNNWIKVKLEGTMHNRDAFGAKVLFYAGNDQWMRETEGGSSHGSQNSSLALAGIAQHDKLDSIIIRWPGGNRQKFTDVEARQTLFIKEGEPDYKVLGCMDEEALNYDEKATKSSGCRYETVMGTKVAPGKEIKIFPNPAKDMVRLVIPKDLRQYTLLLTILDVSGNFIFEAYPSDDEIMIDRTRITRGLYIYQITSEDKVLQRGRLIFR